MRKFYSPPNYDDPVEYLTPPTYYHAPLQVGVHVVPFTSDVAFTLTMDRETGSLTVVVMWEGRNDEA